MNSFFVPCVSLTHWAELVSMQLGRHMADIVCDWIPIWNASSWSGDHHHTYFGCVCATSNSERIVYERLLLCVSFQLTFSKLYTSVGIY
jgi:hypothetical protein